MGYLLRERERLLKVSSLRRERSEIARGGGAGELRSAKSRRLLASKVTLKGIPQRFSSLLSLWPLIVTFLAVSQAHAVWAKLGLQGAKARPESSPHTSSLDTDRLSMNFWPHTSSRPSHERPLVTGGGSGVNARQTLFRPTHRRATRTMRRGRPVACCGQRLSHSRRFLCVGRCVVKERSRGDGRRSQDSWILGRTLLYPSPFLVMVVGNVSLTFHLILRPHTMIDLLSSTSDAVTSGPRACRS